jgi:hypothetical protein
MSATSSGRTPGSNDPSDLERNADEIRADMDRTLNALERKFSLDQLLDRSMGYLREHGADLTQTLGAHMRNNPIPIVLTLTGITWLVASTYNSRQPPGQDLSSRFSRSGVGQKLQQRAASARERLHSTKDRARERLSSGQEAAGGRMSSTVQSTRENARMRAQHVQDRVHTMLDEQPLVLGALAVAVGAIIGAAIPSTQYEDRVLGTARDRTLTKAQELGEQQYENLKGTLQSGESTGTQPGQA